MSRPLDTVGASTYLSEVRELVDSLLFRIDRLKAARNEWLQLDTAARAQATASRDGWSREAFEQALRGAGEQQAIVFDDFEALLAAWARLSLLFHPVAGGPVGAWREERGTILRKLVGLGDNSLLASRSFRDSWMHFDERLDASFIEGWLGNRQQFVRSADVPSATDQTVRVIDVEALSFHYRSRSGAKESVAIADMWTCLTSIREGLATVSERLKDLPPRR